MWVRSRLGVKETYRVLNRRLRRWAVARPWLLAAAAHLRRWKGQAAGFNISRQAEWEQRAEDAVDLWIAAREALGAGGGRVRVADFGAGNERLRGLLASRLGTEYDYYPYDLHPQQPTTKPLDVRQALPSDRFDLVFCLGLVEYIAGDGDFLQRLSECCHFACVSYVITDSSLPLTQRQRETAGWRSHLSAQQFGALLESSNFRVVSTRRTDGDRTGLWLAESLHVPSATPPLASSRT